MRQLFAVVKHSVTHKKSTGIMIMIEDKRNIMKSMSIYAVSGLD